MDRASFLVNIRKSASGVKTLKWSNFSKTVDGHEFHFEDAKIPGHKSSFILFFLSIMYNQCHKCKKETSYYQRFFYRLLQLSSPLSKTESFLSLNF